MPIPFPWLDATTPIHDGMVHWPDNAPVHVKKTLSIATGAAANVTEVSMSAHTGTHVDAPLHFTAHAGDSTTLDLARLMGPARVVAITNPKSISLAEVQHLEIEPGARLLFRTRMSDSEWNAMPFQPDFVALDGDAAAFLRDAGVVCVGVDYLSVGKADAHHALLDAGICVIEGLALQHIAPGDYEMLCLPLKIVDSDGAPARVLLRPQ
ncbi:cyclase family protein [Hymenobacter siberiensis]|uniref:cyclase family protein n=1 Tax=Hymenobacter siberiensis TaxID=2848396 RepID=UPI001C1DEDD4|nr:cyclase family protein [Hymenobacter siberiensis]MBU6121366.1 cyclase family protein [Hymenobacter siberiensis]